MLRERLGKGLVIPAHPLALTGERSLDERRQRALTRYYLAAGAGGLAVGVHTTQFAIRDPGIGLFRPVLERAARAALDTLVDHCRAVATVIPVFGFYLQPASEDASFPSTSGAGSLRSSASWPSRSPPAVFRRRSRPRG